MSLEAPTPDDLARETLAADAVAAHASDGGHNHEPPRLECLNCGTKLAGHYCHHCGQHDFDFHQSFWHVFLEALENFLHFDTKLFRNIITLLFRPGRLSAEFNAGKRAAQMPPFRLYVFTAFVFFIMMFARGSNHGKSSEAIAYSLPGRAIENTRAANEAAEKQALANGKKPAAEKSAKSKDDDNSAFTSWLEERGSYAAAHQAEFADAVLHAVPKMLLICMPFFALFTRFLFRKSGQVYLQHLVIALHIHTFFYLWMLCSWGWTGLVGLPGWGLEGWVKFLCYAWVAVYPFVMLRNLFHNSWPKTVLKTVLLSMAYALTLSFAFLIVAVIYFAWL